MDAQECLILKNYGAKKRATVWWGLRTANPSEFDWMAVTSRLANDTDRPQWDFGEVMQILAGQRDCWWYQNACRVAGLWPPAKWRSCRRSKLRTTETWGLPALAVSESPPCRICCWRILRNVESRNGRSPSSGQDQSFNGNRRSTKSKCRSLTEAHSFS